MSAPMALLVSCVAFIIGTIAIKRPDIIVRLQLGFYTEANYPNNPIMRESIKLLRENPRKWAATPSTTTKFTRLWGYALCFIGSVGLLIVLLEWLPTLLP